MLVPRTRLIFWTSAILLPFAVLAGTVPSAAAIAFACIGLFIMVVLADAVLAGRLLAGIKINLPDVVRLQNRRTGSISVHVLNASERGRLIRIGIAFPREVESPEVDRLVQIPDGAGESKLDWPCVPNRRGQYFLEQVCVETASTFGFWAVRGSRATKCELRVYPDLLAERNLAPSLFLRRTDLGIHAQRYAGQGREFEKLREFVPGDSLSDIHWKASAKRGKPVTKVFQIERTHEVYVVIDASRLSARRLMIPNPDAKKGSGAEMIETSALERYVTASLILALAAEQQGDQFGIVTFSDKVIDFVRARNGQAHFDACRDRLYTLHPHDVSPDFEELFTFIRLRLRKRALLVFLTALDDPVLADSFTKASDLIARQQLLLVNMLQPPMAHPLFSENAPVATTDDLYRRLGGHLQWNSLRELQKVLQRRGIRLSFLDPLKLSAELIAQHAEVRARQLV